MHMSGIDPYAYMQQVAGRLDELTSRAEIETVLDELEYLLHRANSTDSVGC
jgi:hypothetical protein